MPRKAIPGQPLVVSAGDYNAAMNAGQWYEQQRALNQTATGIVSGVNPCIVKIQNDTGGNLAAGTAVELSSSLLTTLDRQHLWLSGIARAGNDPGFGVLIEPVKSGEIGFAQVSGVCLASVDIQDSDNTHARLVPSSTTLKGDFGGPVEILQKPSGTGVKTCVVRLGVRQSIIRRAKAAEDIASGGNGDVNVWINGASRGTITAYNTWDAGDVADTDEIRILYHHDLDKWEILKRGGGGQIALGHTISTLGGVGYVYLDGNSTAEASEPVTVTAAGLWLFPPSSSFSGVTANSLGTVFDKTSPTDYLDPAIDIEQKNLFLVRFYFGFFLESLSAGDADNYLRVATHNHTYTDNGGAMTTGNTRTSALALDVPKEVEVTGTVYLSGGGSLTGSKARLPLFYSTSGEIRQATATTVGIVTTVGGLQGLRFKLARTDGTSVGSPYIYGASVEIQQLGIPSL